MAHPRPGRWMAKQTSIACTLLLGACACSDAPPPRQSSAREPEAARQSATPLPSVNRHGLGPVRLGMSADAFFDVCGSTGVTPSRPNEVTPAESAQIASGLLIVCGGGPWQTSLGPVTRLSATISAAETVDSVNLILQVTEANLHAQLMAEHGEHRVIGRRNLYMVKRDAVANELLLLSTEAMADGTMHVLLVSQLEMERALRAAAAGRGTQRALVSLQQTTARVGPMQVVANAARSREAPNAMGIVVERAGEEWRAMYAVNNSEGYSAYIELDRVPLDDHRLITFDERGDALRRALANPFATGPALP
ncbi:MAG: hypothetical protein AAF411_02680 [Myxococcota bacterium]